MCLGVNKKSYTENSKVTVSFYVCVLNILVLDKCGKRIHCTVVRTWQTSGCVRCSYRILPSTVVSRTIRKRKRKRINSLGKDQRRLLTFSTVRPVQASVPRGFVCVAALHKIRWVVVPHPSSLTSHLPQHRGLLSRSRLTLSLSSETYGGSAGILMAMYRFIYYFFLQAHGRWWSPVSLFERDSNFILHFISLLTQNNPLDCRWTHNPL